jgi:multidrug efflux pump subunit AcrB
MSEAPHKIDDLDLFFKNLDPAVSPNDLSLYGHVYAHLYTEQDKKRNPLGSFANFSISEVQASSDHDEINRYRTLEQEIENLKHGKDTLNTLLQDLQKQLKNLGQPKGVGWGIAVLSYISATSIMFPVWLMPLPSEQFTPVYKWLIVALFISGLISFFIYLVYLTKINQQLSD